MWRYVFVGETDAEAERIGLKAFAEMQEHRSAMRLCVLRKQGSAMPAEAPPLAGADGLIRGSPATVAALIGELSGIGIGGMILQFRLGPMSHADAEQSLRRFAQHVAPEFRPRAMDKEAQPAGGSG
jgi:alkanesulfonate monooxygenase SsuD/methylene tetrahydromethanopterin reductase-like flavin-dependent oxidoreductase (luciferase family)